MLLRPMAGFILVVSLISACSDRQPPRTLESMFDSEVPNAIYKKDENWWVAYGIKELDDLIITALEHNIDLAKAAVAVNKAQYQANLVRSDLLPTFSTTGEGSVTKETGSGAPWSKDLSVEGGFNWELDLWHRLANSLSAREWDFRATELDRESARLSLIFNVIEAYFKLAYLDAAKENTSEVINNLENIHRVILARYEFGKSDSLEVDQAAQSVLSARERLYNIQLQFTEAHQTLRLLLNFRPDDQLELSFPNLLETRHPGPDPNIPAVVLVERPDLRAAEYRLQGAFNDVRAAQKAYLPTFSLQGTIRTSSDRMNRLRDNPISIGLISISLPFLDFNQVRWNLKITEAEYDDLFLDYQNALITSLNEVSSAWAAYNVVVQRTEAINQKYLHDRNISSYYKRRYAAGVGDFSDWMEALSNELETRISLLESKFNHIASENNIYRSMAGRFVTGKTIQSEKNLKSGQTH